MALVPHINAKEYDAVMYKLRDFFRTKGYLETHVQNRLDILAACEDPTTISTFRYPTSTKTESEFPLPQTGQMRLENDLLCDHSLPGIYCLTTSYRAEPKPVPGRHDYHFPLFEFESPGTFDDLVQTCDELVQFLGLTQGPAPKFDYEFLCKLFQVDELTHDHERRLEEMYGPVVFIMNFPSRTSPFFNMKQHRNNPDLYYKMDVIIGGAETIGSAERETDVDMMKANFYTISQGEYAATLFKKFGDARVLDELNQFLAHDFIARFGGGIGITRLIRAMKKYKLLY